VEAGRLALLWVLSLGDGSQDLLGIAQRSGLSFADVHAAASRLEQAGLVRRTGPEQGDR
jgi:aminopeptidase-like protein